MAVSARVRQALQAEPPRAWSRDRRSAKPARLCDLSALCPGIPLARLSHVLRDLFGLDISEGALVNILDASRSFAMQTSLIKRGSCGHRVGLDETG